MNRQFLILAFVALCLSAVPARAELTSFVADAIQKAPGYDERRGKLYVSPLGTRFEYTVKKQKIIQIIQPSRGLFWLLFPQTKTYFEIISAPSQVITGSRNKTPCDITDKDLCRKDGVIKVAGMTLERWTVGVPRTKEAVKVWWDPVRRMYIRQLFPDGSIMIARMSGSRQFEGLLVEQWKMTVTLANGEKNYSYMLFAPDLGFPVMEQGSKGLVKELHNIKPHAPDPSLYEIPANYIKIKMPAKRP